MTDIKLIKQHVLDMVSINHTSSDDPMVFDPPIVLDSCDTNGNIAITKLWAANGTLMMNGIPADVMIDDEDDWYTLEDVVADMMCA